MEQVSRRGEGAHNENHLRNFQNNLQPRYSPNDDVQYEPVNLALTNLILPITFLGITLLGIIFVFIILFLWWRSVKETWKYKTKRRPDTMVKTMAEFSPENSNFKIQIVEDTAVKPRVEFIDESEIKIPIVTARTYGGSPKLLDEPSTSKRRDCEKFVFPSGDTKEVENEVKKIPKLPLPEHQWLQTHKKTIGYKATIPRPFAKIVKSELDDDATSKDDRAKKFSITRSPSLEKDEKSPFVSSAKSDKSDVFGFDSDVIKVKSETIKVCVQPEAVNQENVNRNFNNNVTPISPKELSSGIHRSISVDKGSIESSSRLRRFRSVNTKLNICCINETPVERNTENIGIQNSPKILECQSAQEKSSASKFNFSPKLLTENRNSPQFFTPTDKVSPQFFTPSDKVSSQSFFSEASPKSVYYDSVRSPKFFPATPKSPISLSDTEKPMSPKPFSEQTQNGSLEKQYSPRVLISKLSPKVYSNKENYFSFDTKNTDLSHQRFKDETDTHASRRSPKLLRYGGRKSIEREKFSGAERVDVRKYRRHNSCEANYRNLENINTTQLLKTDPFAKDTCQIDETVNDNELATDYQNNSDAKDNEGSDVVDCTVLMQRLVVSPIEEDTSFRECLHTPHTAHERRQRLKSISLDSDNAKIIEQNLGIPVAKQLKEEMLESFKDQEYSASCENVKSTETTNFEAAQPVEHKFKFSPTLQKKALRDSSDPASFVDMPRFSPKEFELTITSDESANSPKRKSSKNPRNLTIDLSRRDSDLEKEIIEFERLYTNAEERKPKTPTLKVKATSLDSSDSHLSIPQQHALEVPQNSVSVPNTPKRQLKRLLNQKNLIKPNEMCSGGKFGYSSLQCPNERRSFMKDSIYLRDANLSIYQPAISRANSRLMGSFDENMSDFTENPEINVETCDVLQSTSSIFGYKQNLSVSSTNLKTLPEGVQSNDFEPTNDDKVTKKLHRRGSNQMLSLDSKYSLQSSNCSLPSTGHSSHNLASIRNSTSNFSLNTDNRKKNPLERRCSNVSMNTELVPSTTKSTCLSSSNLQIVAGNPEMAQSKNCLLQRRGSNNSLTLNLHGGTLSRYSSNSSLNANKDVKVNQRKGLLERRSSNTSLTLNINSSNPQLSTNRALSISNYNLNGSTCNLSRHNSNQSVSTDNKKGILERRSSNTSLTLNLQADKCVDTRDLNASWDSNVPRDIEVDENTIDPHLKDAYQHREHRKSLSTENLIPRSYKTRLKLKTDNSQIGFGSHDDLWSESYAHENPDICSRQNLTYVCGDQENEIIYAFGAREIDAANFGSGFIRNITTKPLSPQTTSEDFKLYLANIQHLQNASSCLSREQLKDLNNVFQNGYSKVKCDCISEDKHKCSGKVAENSETESSESFLPCSEYQKAMLRNLHQEFWDLPTNFQEKPLVFGSHPKNRYKSILPNEHSRVILKGYGSDDAEGYINANFIKGHEYSRDSYIATQAPLQNTIYDFWAMVRQNTTKFRGHKKKRHKEMKTNEKPRDCIQKIVMLTNFIENNNQKCEKYFPLDIDEEITFTNTESKGKFLGGTSTDEKKTDDIVTIKNCGIIVQTGYTIRKLEVQFKKRTGGVAEVLNATTSGELCCEEVKVSSQKRDKSNKYSHNSSTDKDISYLSNKTDKLLNKTTTEDSKSSVQISSSKSSSEMENTKIKARKNQSCERDNDGESEFEIGNTESTDCRAETDTNNKRKSESKEDFADDSSDKESSEFINETITVHHYWFHNWADHKCPKDVNALLKLSLDILEDTVHDFDTPTAKNIDPECTCTVTPKVSTKFVFPPLESQVSESSCVSNIDSRRVEIKNDLDCPPTIVHCSAGIGRTGCLIAILNGIKQLHNDHKVDVLGIVCNMRLNRGGMVQNSEQYELIHKVLCLYEQKCLPEL